MNWDDQTIFQTIFYFPIRGKRTDLFKVIYRGSARVYIGNRSKE